MQREKSRYQTWYITLYLLTDIFTSYKTIPNILKSLYNMAYNAQATNKKTTLPGAHLHSPGDKAPPNQ